MKEKYLTPVEVVQALQEGKKVLSSHYGHRFKELDLTSSLESILSGDFEFKLAPQTVEKKADDYVVKHKLIFNYDNHSHYFKRGFVHGYNARAEEEGGAE